MLHTHKRILFALDVPTVATATALVDKLHDHVGGFKVGLELFVAAGPGILGTFDRSIPVMLDLKLHDIPETVERAVQRAGDLGVKFLTIHVQQRETMRRAVAAAEPFGLQILVVTVLTSMTERDGVDLRFNASTVNPLSRVVYLAKLAAEEGVSGFVASPQEVGMIRSNHPTSVIVVPGIRPAGAAGGDDQKRTGTPLAAVRAGASYIVVGRPIRDAADPVAAAKAIADDIEGNAARV